jgi:hypothetical protein
VAEHQRSGCLILPPHHSALVISPLFVLLAMLAQMRWLRWLWYWGFAEAQRTLFVMFSRAAFIG